MYYIVKISDNSKVLLDSLGLLGGTFIADYVFWGIIVLVAVLACAGLGGLCYRRRRTTTVVHTRGAPSDAKDAVPLLPLVTEI